MRSALGVVILLCSSGLLAQSAPAPTPARPLDLRVGDLAKYLPPGEAAKLQTDRPPVAAVDTVVVQGKREQIPDRLQARIPGGAAGVIWSLFHPTQAWRLLVPDPNTPPAEPPRNNKPPAVPRIGCGPGTNVIFCN
jgi:hypothetical protein